MADKDFFEEKQETVEEVQEEVIKLGEKEYTQEDLQKLVGLGELAQEIETKQNTKLDRVYPEFTKTAQKLSETEKRLAELEATQAKAQPTGEELTPEQKEFARKQLNDLGYGQDSFRQIVREELAAKDLLSDINTLIYDSQEAGNPKTTPEALLDHMRETGIKVPSKAYKDMFEKELDEIKEKKLAEIKPAGMVTSNKGQAGGKTPAPVAPPKNRQELEARVAEMLGGSN